MKHNKILLYPGGFKPFHDGHLYLLDNIIFNEHIDEVHIFIGNTPRDMITVDDSLIIINSCIDKLKKLYDIPIYCHVVSGSPISKCYSMINNDNVHENIYGLLSSCKDTDAKRTHAFYESYLDGGVYNTNKWYYNKAFDINVEQYNPVLIDNTLTLSSSYLRKCIHDNNWDEFIKGYRYMLENDYITIDIIRSLFDKYCTKQF